MSSVIAKIDSYFKRFWIYSVIACVMLSSGIVACIWAAARIGVVGSPEPSVYVAIVIGIIIVISGLFVLQLSSKYRLYYEIRYDYLPEGDIQNIVRQVIDIELQQFIKSKIEEQVTSSDIVRTQIEEILLDHEYLTREQVDDILEEYQNRNS